MTSHRSTAVSLSLSQHHYNCDRFYNCHNHYNLYRLATDSTTLTSLTMRTLLTTLTITTNYLQFPDTTQNFATG